MPTLRETKDRIQSVKNTQKITRAMKMVASAHVKKAEVAVKSGRPFAMEMYTTFVEIYNSIPDKKFEPVRVENPLENFPVLLEKREIKTLGLVVISSNKGLAGAYTSNIVRYAEKLIKRTLKHNIKVKLFLIGQKAEAQIVTLSKTYDFEIKEIYSDVLDDFDIKSVDLIAQDLAKSFVSGEIDELRLITTRYINMMSYKAEQWPLLPVIDNRNKRVLKFFKEEFNIENDINYKTFFEQNSSVGQKFEPSVQECLKKIVPMYIVNTMYQAILEAKASELASRMTAMSAATKNAEDMIKRLTISYNKARQEAITLELTEVISSSMAKK